MTLLKNIKIYIDFQNTSLNSQQLVQLITFVKERGQLLQIKLYYNPFYPCPKLDKIKTIDFPLLQLNSVPCDLKDSLDNQLIADCLDDIHSDISPDIIVLISGDGDFVKLVQTLHRLEKEVITFARRGNIKKRLKEITECHWIDELSLSFVEQKLLPPSLEKSTKQEEKLLSFEEGKKLLLECLKICENEGYKSDFPRLNDLMKKKHNYYQGINSLLHPETNKPFTKFRTFIELILLDKNFKYQLKNNIELILKQTKNLSLSYDKAVQLLISVIQKNQPNQTSLNMGQVDQLMRKACPQYTGSKSICQPNSSNSFSSFKKFIEKVIQDGKIKKQNQLLFIVS